VCSAETPEQDLARRIAAARAAAAELKARRRALGNMQFIGYLYKQALLTETVLHTCVQTLLADNASVEELECMVKLLETTGAYSVLGVWRLLVCGDC
jgi:translation initiation factor 4G